MADFSEIMREIEEDIKSDERISNNDLDNRWKVINRKLKSLEVLKETLEVTNDYNMVKDVAKQLDIDLGGL